MHGDVADAAEHAPRALGDDADAAALHGADVAQLRDFVRRTGQRCADVEDVLAAAGQAVVDEMENAPRANLHDVIRRVAQIERDALAFGARRDVEGNVRTAYAS